MLEPSVIFEDESILVLDKPAGWVVNDANTAHGNPIIQNWLKSKYSYQLSQSDEKRSGVVHRLDKETSGILVVAKTVSSFENLQTQFKERVIQKSYIALVHGALKDREGVISVSVGRLPWNRERFGVLTAGKEAETRYHLIDVFKDKMGNMYSLLELIPKTGRTHQIRVHLKYLGHTVVADHFYAGRKTAKRDRLWCNRLFLHSKEISFRHPQNNKHVIYKSNLPDDLSIALETLSKV